MNHRFCLRSNEFRPFFVALSLLFLSYSDRGHFEVDLFVVAPNFTGIFPFPPDTVTPRVGRLVYPEPRLKMYFCGFTNLPSSEIIFPRICVFRYYLHNLLSHSVLLRRSANFNCRRNRMDGSCSLIFGFPRTGRFHPCKVCPHSLDIFLLVIIYLKVFNFYTQKNPWRRFKQQHERERNCFFFQKPILHF